MRKSNRLKHIAFLPPNCCTILSKIILHGVLPEVEGLSLNSNTVYVNIAKNKAKPAGIPWLPHHRHLEGKIHWWGCCSFIQYVNVIVAHAASYSCALTVIGFTSQDPYVLTLIGLTAQDFLG